MNGENIKTKILEVPNQDTPQSVNIPNTWTGFISWMFARFGIGIVGFAFAYVIYVDVRESNAIMYGDFRARDERVLKAYEDTIKVHTDFRNTIHAFERNQDQMKQALDAQTRLLDRIEKALSK